MPSIVSLLVLLLSIDLKQYANVYTAYHNVQSFNLLKSFVIKIQRKQVKCFPLSL